MQRYRCPTCGGDLWFQNTQCLACGSELYFVPGRQFVTNSPDIHACANRATIGCNWAAEVEDGLCRSCRHTTVIPDLSVAGNAEKWAKLEQAKRPLIRMLIALGLPLSDRDDNPVPVFEFKSDAAEPEGKRVLTGHADGVITLNLTEADDAERERIRTEMGEPYRTLAGHFRHEVAHHYWQVLAEGHEDRLSRLRAGFGDDRADYGAALERHYAEGAPAGWEQNHISAYATAHPWEDFAETWAHLFHMLEGLEAGLSSGLVPQGELPASHPRDLLALPMQQLAEAWIELSLALNLVNEAMGHQSFYPFLLTPGVVGKLDLVRGLILDAEGEAAQAA